MTKSIPAKYRQLQGSVKHSGYPACTMDPNRILPFPNLAAELERAINNSEKLLRNPYVAYAPRY